eukprot:gene14762-biopygen596
MSMGGYSDKWSGGVRCCSNSPARHSKRGATTAPDGANRSQPDCRTSHTVRRLEMIKYHISRCSCFCASALAWVVPGTAPPGARARQGTPKSSFGDIWQLSPGNAKRHSGAETLSANLLERSLEVSELKLCRAFRIIRFGHGPGSEPPERAAGMAKPPTFLCILGVL